MKKRCLAWILAAAVTSATSATSAMGVGSGAWIPEALEPWEAWVLKGHEERLAPSAYDDAGKRFDAWPSRLSLKVGGAGADFVLDAVVFAPAWVALPGGREHWPVSARMGGKPVPVVERDGVPGVRLLPGEARIEGNFAWPEAPARLAIPQSVGVLTLELDGQAVAEPAWDASGFLWLRREAVVSEAERDFLTTALYAMVEDGIPVWLRVDVELAVSGKSREEDIGVVLPEGWKLAAVESPIPVVVDAAGKLKAQVRAGKWSVRLSAFRLDDVRELRFAAGAPVSEALVGLRARPGFRVVEFEGAQQVDVSQTTFPQAWRGVPVFRWELGEPLRLVERMRGEGSQTAPGLSISRSWWLDEQGGGITFRDQIRGEGQRLWRLDASPGQELGSVRSGGEGQLVTRDPRGGAAGFEVRTRTFDVTATGRMPVGGGLPASGWQAPAESLDVTLNLPPGWRLFAMGGADWVRGDWLTAWTLLDLFVLLVFSLAVYRLWGFGAAALAFAGFALAYHEPGAPRFVWLFLLLPLALLRVVKPGWGREFVVWWKWLAVVILVAVLAPFVTSQVQQALYPQLENLPDRPGAYESVRSEISQMALPSSAYAAAERESKQKAQARSNLMQDANVRIQTGPGVPDWTWRTVSFGWNGPVSATQTVRPVLIPSGLERVLSVLRVVLLLGLAFVLLKSRRGPPAATPPPLPVAAAILLALAPSLHAQFPSPELLDQLRERLLETPDAFPRAAEIPEAVLRVDARKLSMELRVDVAARCAVPVPGRFAAWSPVTVAVNGLAAPALRRGDGFLWVVLEPGVHTVSVVGVMADASEWEWAFQLRPRRVRVEAPGWTVSGVRPDGTPEQQVFLTREERAAAIAETGFDRQELQALAIVERHIELGLRWQARTTVRRLSPPGKAISLRIPLLDGENVLSARAVVEGNFVEVRLGAQDGSFAWESELEPREQLPLATRAGDAWVERWSLAVSPVWNVALSGLPPTFEPGSTDLEPVWRPWPGESAAIAVSRPEAVPGPTVTVRQVAHEVSIGARQRTATLRLTLESSLGEDFAIQLPEGAEVTSLARGGEPLPVRMDGGLLVVPLTPGEQEVQAGWRTPEALAGRASAGAVTLPVESANIATSLRVPESRWVLWAHGPERGPAVRFWTVLVCALLAAWALSRASFSPLPAFAWMVLALGLTQVPLPAALLVVAWFLFLALKTRDPYQKMPPVAYNLAQILLILLTFAAAIVFIAVVAAGLLGDPEMFIAGNGSTATDLRWYRARSGPALPDPGVFSVSIWWYRLAMLVWALWLAVSMLRWARWAWEQFSAGGCFRGPAQPAVQPPPVP